MTYISDVAWWRNESRNIYSLCMQSTDTMVSKATLSHKNEKNYTADSKSTTTTSVTAPHLKYPSLPAIALCICFARQSLDMLCQKSSLNLLYKAETAKKDERKDLAVFWRFLVSETKMWLLRRDFETHVMGPVCWVERMSSWCYRIQKLHWDLWMSHHPKIKSIKGWYSRLGHPLQHCVWPNLEDYMPRMNSVTMQQNPHLRDWVIRMNTDDLNVMPIKAHRLGRKRANPLRAGHSWLSIATELAVGLMMQREKMINEAALELKAEYKRPLSKMDNVFR